MRCGRRATLPLGRREEEMGKSWSVGASERGGAGELHRRDAEDAETGSAEVSFWFSFFAVTRFFRLDNIFFILAGLAREFEIR